MHGQLSRQGGMPHRDIQSAVCACIEHEKNRRMAQRSVHELERYYAQLVEYCSSSGIKSVSQLTPQFLKDYVIHCSQRGGPTLVKAIVWALRKLGAYIVLAQLLPQNPAKHLHHPKISPRAKLPEYLSARQLRNLLETAALGSNNCGSVRDLAILSLLATTGLRPHEIVSLRRGEIYLHQHRLHLHVKGGWVKKTPLGSCMADLLASYLQTRTDKYPSAFLNQRGRPVAVSWVQRMVRSAGDAAGLPVRLTCRHLRHTFATHAADRHGRTITRALLGHRLPSTTQVYIHLSPRRFRSVMNLHPYQTVVGKEVEK